MTRLLGIDYGQKRIGLAVSDPTGVIASPAGTVANTGLRAAAEAVRGHCARLGVSRVIVGLPLRLDGGDSASTKAARDFAERLRTGLTIPVELWDERFSTVTAERALIEGGARRRRRRQVIDQAAAQVTLQHYLDSHAPPAEPGDGDPGPP